MSIFWSCWIIVLTLTNLVLLFWILMANRRIKVADDGTNYAEAKKTGHVYDGIEEYDNPLPRWWFGLFLATFIFAVGYLIVYPGLGLWKGVIGWTEVNQLQGEQDRAQAKYDEVFGVYGKTAIPELAKD